jgi:ATP-dependent Clp protease ATP-binding subunit ClpA
MWEKFTSSAKRVVKNAHDIAKQYHAFEVEPIHLLWGILKDDKSFAVKIITTAGGIVQEIQKELEDSLLTGNSEPTELNFNVEVKNVLEFAYKEARMLRHTFIGSEHLLLGILRLQSSDATEILKKHGLTYDLVKKTILQLIHEIPSRPLADDRNLAQEFATAMLPTFDDRPKSQPPVRESIPVKIGRRITEEMALDIVEGLFRRAELIGHGDVSLEDLIVAFVRGYDEGPEARPEFDTPQEPKSKPESQKACGFSAAGDMWPSAKSALDGAIRQAILSESCRIEVEHIVLGLLGEGETHVAKRLIGMGIDLTKLEEALKESMAVDPYETGSIVFSENANSAIQLSGTIAKELGHEAIEADDLFLGILSLENTKIEELLMRLGVTFESYYKAIKDSKD